MWTFTFFNDIITHASRKVIQGGRCRRCRHCYMQVIAALDQAEATDKAPLRDLFTDVYDKPPPNLVEQEQQVRGHVAKHRADYPDNIALD
jgi:hypothetical protein